jgi:hypothetical protein
MRWRIPLVVLLALFVSVSCDQQPSEPLGEQTVAETPGFNFMNGPEVPGKAPVSRFVMEDTHYWCTSTDPERDLIATRYDPFEFFCLGDPAHPDWEIQTINHSRNNYSGQGFDTPIYVYSFTDWITAPDWCAFLDTGWLYQGTVDFRANETWNGDESEGMFQFRANGVVYDQDGNKHSYREHQKLNPTQGWTHEDIVVN